GSARLKTSSRVSCPKERGSSTSESTLSAGAAENLFGELRINLGQLRCDDLAKHLQGFGRWRRRLRDVVRSIEIESCVFADLVDRVARVHARQREAPIGESEQAAVG